MGLDMYLSGRKFVLLGTDKRYEDGFEVESIEVRIGYWRKHPDLHGYIVANFGPPADSIRREGPISQTFVGLDGIERADICNDIGLSLENLNQIIEAVKGRKLPHTTGFFFGKSASDPDEVEEEIKEDVEQLSKAVAWLTEFGNSSEYIRSVVYHASW